MMGRTVILPIAADYAFANSLKGQRGSFMGGGNAFSSDKVENYTRLYKMYFFWNELERTIEDGTDYIREVCDRRFGDCKKANVRFIPRILAQWPNCGDHTKATAIDSYFPTDMVPSTLDTPEFFFRVRNLVKKLGEVWNDDPRIAYIEMGIYGLWGEEHEDSLSRAAQRNLADAFHEFFPNKLCMLRCPRDCMGEGFGMYWDSFAHIDEEFYAQDALRFIDWRKAVMGGEMAHNWGRHEIQPGDDMNDTLIGEEHTQRFLDYVFWQHNNHLGMHLEKDERYERALPALAAYQKRAGYRFVIDRVEYEAQQGVLDVAFDVRNIGASPFYYRWPVSAALLDAQGRPVWEQDFDADIRTWMPGDKWNFERAAYEEPAAKATVSGRFDVSGVPDGVYMLALAIKDPSCGRPNVRFATRQYLRGGWHPMGYIGLNEQVDDPVIPLSCFDDQREDNTIGYD